MSRMLGWAGVCGALFGLSAVPAYWGETSISPNLVAALFLGSVLALLSTIDVLTYRLPDMLTLPLGFAGILIAAFQSVTEAVWHAIAAIAGFAMLYAVAAFYKRHRGKDGLGLGDAKLLAAAGAWVGIEGLPSVLLLASGIALTGAGMAMLAGLDVKGDTRIPFGPFIAFGSWLVWLYGPVV